MVSLKQTCPLKVQGWKVKTFCLFLKGGRSLNSWNDYQKLLLQLIDLVVVLKMDNCCRVYKSVQMYQTVALLHVSYDSRTCFKVLIWNFYLSLSWMHIEKKYFWDISVWAALLLEKFQNRSAFEIEHGKTCPFSSQIRSSIPTFRDMHLLF